MERYARAKGSMGSRFACSVLRKGMILLLIWLLMGVCGLLKPERLLADEKGKGAVLPFRVHALKGLDHLKLDFQKKLTQRMKGKGFSMISPEKVNKHALAFLPVLKTRALFKAGKDLKVKWILSGSITQIGERLSIDLKVVDVTRERPPFFVFMVAEDLDALPVTAERIAASIDYQVVGVAQIDSVRVKGNQRIEKEAILAVIGTKKGDKLDPDRLDKDLRAIYKMGFFEDVKTEAEDGPSGKIITFKVVEKPSINRIEFIGNKKVDSKDLMEQLGIKPYSILNHSEIKQGVNRLKDHYRKEGYYNVQINDRIVGLPYNEVVLEFEIMEHEKVHIHKIEFVGNTRFDDGDLKDIMETSEEGWFSWLSWIVDPGFLDKKKLEYDLHKITSFYHNHGYIKAKVGEPKISYQRAKGLTISIEVQEGDEYGVGRVSVEGDLVKPADQLLKKVRIGKEKVFNREVVRKDILALKDVYADEGYAYAEVAPVTKEDDKRRVVGITYNISKAQRVRFERITIAGNTKTRDKVIRRELKVFEGEYFSGKALKRSTQNLHRLGYFEDVEVQRKKGSAEDRMSLDIRVKEKPTGSFSFGAGYSSVDEYMGTAKIEQKNFLGYGLTLTLSGRIGGKSSQFDLLFTEPWLFEIPLSATVRAYKWEREYDDYTKDAWGGSYTMGYPLAFIDDFIRVWGTYQLEHADLDDIDDDAALVIRDMEGRNVTSSVTTGLIRNSTDRRWDPTRGSINSFSAQYAGLGGDSHFTKLLAKSAWFFPLPWDTVILAQGRWGMIDELSDNGLPVYEKFFLGGINTVRGFDYTDISPEDPDTGDAIGGKFMQNYNLEFRFPLLKGQGLSGVVFFDAGGVSLSGTNAPDTYIRTSIGGGVRWYSPLGPLRLEYGFNLDPRDDEDSGQVEFSIGTSF
ncbi:MAG: outer membrane protein assembly factor BamA [Deltaproteobacteria bacterium]|nr:outer membrane protein assembly factor BamA [Deltaproteobacteria bacterium]